MKSNNVRKFEIKLRGKRIKELRKHIVHMAFAFTLILQRRVSPQKPTTVCDWFMIRIGMMVRNKMRSERESE